MKRLVLILISVMVLIGLSGCGGQNRLSVSKQIEQIQDNPEVAFKLAKKENSSKAYIAFLNTNKNSKFTEEAMRLKNIALKKEKKANEAKVIANKKRKLANDIQRQSKNDNSNDIMVYLMLKIKNNNIDDVKKILSKYKNINLNQRVKISYRRFMTPLSHALTSNSTSEMIELLLKNGANPDYKSGRSYMDGSENASSFSYVKNLTTFKLLLKYNKNPITNSTDIIVNQSSFGLVESFTAKDEKERLEYLKLLKEKNILDISNIGVLDLVNMPMKLTNFFLENGINPNMKTPHNARSWNDYPLIIGLMDNGKTGSVYLVLSKGANVNAKDRHGNTALHSA